MFNDYGPTAHVIAAAFHPLRNSAKGTRFNVRFLGVSPRQAIEKFRMSLMAPENLVVFIRKQWLKAKRRGRRGADGEALTERRGPRGAD